MMEEEMNRWGGGGVVCVACGFNTVSPAFVGRLRCCKERVGLCQECKGNPGFSESSPAQVVQSWARWHTGTCSDASVAVAEQAEEEAEKWHKIAGELFRELSRVLVESTTNTHLPPAGVETALVLLVRTFCRSTDLPISIFISNLLNSSEEKGVSE